MGFMKKLSENQGYYDNGPSVAKIGAAVEELVNKMGRACSKQRSDIVLNAIGNLLAFEIAHRLDTDQQAAADLFARKKVPRGCNAIWPTKRCSLRVAN